MLTIMIRRMEEMRRGGGAVEDQAWQIREQIGWFIRYRYNTYRTDRLVYTGDAIASLAPGTMLNW